MNTLLITNVQLPIDGLENATVAIRNGQFIAINSIPDDFTAEETIDAQGQWLIPGLVDLAARFREPGAKHKATIANEAMTALNAGITTACLPPDTQPPIDSSAVVEAIQHKAMLANGCKVHMLAALTKGLEGQYLSEMAALKASGCVGVGQGLAPLANSQVMRRAMEYAAGNNLTVHLHAINPWLSENGCAHEGTVAVRLGLTGIPDAAETVELGRLLALAEETGVRLHVCRLSTAGAVDLIRDAKSRGVKVTADVAAHQLWLTHDLLEGFAANAHVIPPLREQTDLMALRAGIFDGSIDAICSDHQPHDPDAKLAPFPATEPGISALESFLPLILKLIHEAGLPAATVLRAVTQNPAEILNINAGTIAANKPADWVLLNPTEPMELTQLASMGQNSPFLAQEFLGTISAVGIHQEL